LPIARNLFITVPLMLKELFTALLCGFAIVGQMRAQEVVVAREAKPNPTERVEPVSAKHKTAPHKACNKEPFGDV
jgi:hypothetical protein